jgi:hypothetical protein
MEKYHLFILSLPMHQPAVVGERPLGADAAKPSAVAQRWARPGLRIFHFYFFLKLNKS